MLVIGHRGARGLANENTIESMQAGIDDGALILEIDVQLSQDGVPIVLHDNSLLRTHGIRAKVRHLDYSEIKKLTSNGFSIPTLEEALNEYWGRVYLNIEVKSRGTGRATAELIKRKFIKSQTDWENCFISSFSVRELKAARSISKKVNLALIQNRNPFAFLAYARTLNLVAVGFHRLYTNPLATGIAKKLNMFTYAYTVNRPKGALIMAEKDIDAIVTDYPQKMLLELEKYSLLD